MDIKISQSQRPGAAALIDVFEVGTVAGHYKAQMRFCAMNATKAKTHNQS
jgi:hypothetical protein